MTVNGDPSFEEKLVFCLKNDMRNLVNFNVNSGKSETFTLMGYFCQKYVMFEPKKDRGVVS